MEPNEQAIPLNSNELPITEQAPEAPETDELLAAEDGLELDNELEAEQNEPVTQINATEQAVAEPSTEAPMTAAPAQAPVEVHEPTENNG
jgi:hypothetical protein